MRREVLNKLEEVHGAKPFERPFPVEFANRTRPEWGMCALSYDTGKSSTVIDRELDQGKSLGPSGPHQTCPDKRKIGRPKHSGPDSPTAPTI